MNGRFWAGFDLLLDGLLIILAVVLSMFDQDWRLVGVLGGGFVVWGVIELVRDMLGRK